MDLNNSEMQIDNKVPIDRRHHCKEAIEIVHEIVCKTQELFNVLKNRNQQQPPEEERKKVRVKEYLNLIQQMFNQVRYHYNAVTEACAGLSHIQLESLIPYKDDPDSYDQIIKHTQSLMESADSTYIETEKELVQSIKAKDEKLAQVVNELRNFIYEINTMLHNTN